MVAEPHHLVERPDALGHDREAERLAEVDNRFDHPVIGGRLFEEIEEKAVYLQKVHGELPQSDEGSTPDPEVDEGNADPDIAELLAGADGEPLVLREDLLRDLQH